MRVERNKDCEKKKSLAATKSSKIIYFFKGDLCNEYGRVIATWRKRKKQKKKTEPNQEETKRSQRRQGDLYLSGMDKNIYIVVADTYDALSNVTMWRKCMGIANCGKIGYPCYMTRKNDKRGLYGVVGNQPYWFEFVRQSNYWQWIMDRCYPLIRWMLMWITEGENLWHLGRQRAIYSLYGKRCLSLFNGQRSDSKAERQRREGCYASIPIPNLPWLVKRSGAREKYRIPLLSRPAFREYAESAQ